MKYLRYFESEKLYKYFEEGSDEYEKFLNNKETEDFSENDLSKIKKIFTKNGLSIEIIIPIPIKKSLLYLKVISDPHSIDTIEDPRKDPRITRYEIERFTDHWFIFGISRKILNRSIVYSPYLIDGWDGLEEFIENLMTIE